MSQSGAYALVLADERDQYRIPIIIGVSEAQSIAIQLEQFETQRPLTHDLMKSLMDQVHVLLVEVFIYKWEAGIYYSQLLFHHPDGEIRLDARTSDAVALALRAGAPIFVSPGVLEKTAISVQGNEIILHKTESGPESGQPIFSREELTRLLEEAVAREDYESASRYRDLLKSEE